MEAYFDNSATTRVLPEVKDVIVKTFLEDYGNPSSLHLKGVEAEKYLKSARESIAKILKVSEKEIVFTSGGTESNNMAIIGCAMANRRRGNHLITTQIEHASVIEPMKFLEENGFEVTYLPVDENGFVDKKALEDSIRKDTVLVSVMAVNNEIGTIEPIEEIASMIKTKNPDTYFHVDAIQGFGKLRLHPKKAGIDMMSVSSHKIHGPKGVGFLYINEKAKIKPIIYGGGHQRGMRSGTDNVPGVAGMAEAAKHMYDGFEAKQNHLYEIREYFISRLAEVEAAHVNGLTDRRFAPHVVSVSFDKIRSEVLLHALEDKGIYVSAGSACSSNKPQVSRTLTAIGLPKEALSSTVRFSFGLENTTEEIDYCIEVLKEIVPVLQKYVRK